ncbi:MAG: SpoIIE family protein phosphatase [Salinivirgaceae bacterium]|nr:SpoIIE family protein phosphatase [Salinivirgaceae bacterium]
MRRLISLLAICLALGANAQINKYGNPFITCYPPEVYNEEDQNWAIVQDNRGFVYVANYQSVLEYDGTSWRSIEIPNAAYVYSLALGDDGVVYVGAINQFGYIAPDSIGNLVYKSLSEQVPDSVIFTGVLDIYYYNGKVYFCSYEYDFVYSGGQLESVYQLPDMSTRSFIMNDTLYVGNMLGGINNVVTGSQLLDEKKIAAGAIRIHKLDNDNYILFLNGATVFKYNIKTGKLKKCKSHAFDNLKSYNLYSVTKTDRGYVASVLFSDDFTFVLTDTLLNFTSALNTTNGLIDKIGVNSYVSNTGVMWGCLNYGIAKAEIGSPLRVSNEINGLSGQITDIIEHNGIMYVATYNGVYYKTSDAQEFMVFRPVDGFESSAFALLEFKIKDANKSKLLCATQTGLYEIQGTKAVKIKLLNNNLNEQSISFFQQSNVESDKLYIGTNLGLTIYKYTDKGWVEDKDPRFKQVTGDVSWMSEDAKGNFWTNPGQQGIMMFPYGQDTVYSYDEEDGINTEQVNMKLLRGHLFFCTADGIMEFCDSTQRFVRSSYFGEFLADTTKGVYRIQEYGDGFVMSCRRGTHQNWIEIAQPDGAGGFKVFNTPFLRLPNKWADAVYVDSEGTVWIGASNNLFSYHTEKPYACEAPISSVTPFNVHIRSVIANDSEVIFNGAFTDEEGKLSLVQNPKQEIVLPYSQRNLDITYSATFFEESSRTEYSTILKGSENVWSKWSNRTEVTHNNLSEGQYTFMVKARNLYGVESNVAEYTFRIKPPFYRTIVAYILYVILLVVLVYGIVKWNTRRLIEEKKRLEQKIAEATEEIRGQNVQLEQQKDEIEKQKDEIQSSINYARRIQRALLTPDATIDRIFPDHFLLYKPRNVVSGDYYWFGQFGDYKVSIVADCTGHGVPGGFMSMLGMTNLNYIVGPELSPDMILNKLREAIITSLRQRTDEDNPDGEKKDRSQDGMDVAMYVLNETTMTLSFAGANNPLVLIRDGEAQVIKASKMPVGIYAKLDPFERVDLEVKKGDCLYTFSDGFQDQFGFESGRKFMSKHLRELLVEIHQKPMAEQKEILNTTYEAWRGPAEHQTDDVVLFGLRI